MSLPAHEMASSPSSSSSVVVAAAVCALLCASFTSASAVEKKRARLCGPYLVDALDSLCNGEIFDPTQKRHSGSSRTNLPAWVSLLEPAGNPKLGFLDAKTALQLLRPSPRFGRQTRGIIEECCHKSCSLSELMSYCKVVKPADED